MKKTARNNLILDRLHKGVVVTCIGLTFYGCFLLSLRVHRYFTVIRPARQEQDLKMIKEGSSDNIDKAPDMRT